MANQEHFAKLREGVEAWNEWRKAHLEVRPNLSNCDLARANLDEANLSRSDLRGANISEATLWRADLSTANLSRAMLKKANLDGADLYGADLSMSDLRKANLMRVRLSHASLANADLTLATVGGTIFDNVDLTTAKGLDSVQHLFRSTIIMGTIKLSSDPIPMEFLRGCGVPEDTINNLLSLITQSAIQYYSCFISYSTKDQEFADRLHADLQNKGVRCWFAPHDVQGGKKLHEQIDEAIRRYERLLLILSPNSMSSNWVETEIRHARNRELAEGKRVLFPVRLTPWDGIRKWELFNADEGRDLATEIREYYIPDFSEWKNHDSYAREFEKLLRDLRTEESKSA
jgi:hypothetical protein